MKNGNKKYSPANFVLVIASTAFTFLVMELAFPHVLHRIPLAWYPALDPGFMALADSSKKSVIPENYIALVGDSYAQGKGDWYTRKRKEYWFSTADFHSAHILHHRTGKDVITFGSSGAGSLTGLVAKPITQYLHINSLWAFTLEKPETILVYFYEGNDLTDNVLDLDVRYGADYSMQTFYDPQYFRKFIEETVLGKHRLYNRESFWDNFLFTRFFLKGLKNTGKEIRRGWRKLKKAVSKISRTPQAYAEEKTDAKSEETPQTLGNIALVGGKEVVLPDGKLAGGPLQLTEEELKWGIYMFEQALLYMADYFKESDIKIVYIPSPLNAYHLLSPKVSIKSYMWHKGRGNVFESRRVNEINREVCRKIESIARVNNFEFLDTTPFVRNAGAKDMIHGPSDWHFNEKGYHVLADAIITAFFDEKGSSENFGCDS